MMLDLMVHDFDYARWVAGDVVRVFAKATRTSASPDHALAILTHRRGAISHLEGSWAYPPSIFLTRLEIAGTAGLIECTSPAAAAIEMYLRPENGPSQEVPLPTSPLQESPYTTQLRAFHEALVQGSEPPVRAEDGAAAVQIACAAIESVRRGTPVEIDQEGELR
jgi:predicted dehydrogenase